MFTSRARGVLILLLLTACSPTRGCVESGFELAPESRLPTWLHLPPDVKRSDVEIALDYYVPPFPVDDTVFVIRVKGRKYKEVTAMSWHHPRTQKQLDAYYATEPRPPFPHPYYQVIEVDGQIDVIEHRDKAEQNREPLRALFWMCEDPEVLREARASAGDRAQLRH